MTDSGNELHDHWNGHSPTRATGTHRSARRGTRRGARRIKPVPGRADEVLLNVKQTGWMVEEDRWQRRISAGA